MRRTRLASSLRSLGTPLSHTRRPTRARGGEVAGRTRQTRGGGATGRPRLSGRSARSHPISNLPGTSRPMVRIWSLVIPSAINPATSIL